MNAARPVRGHVPGGAAVFQRMYTRLGCQGRPPRFVVEFYPYANLTLSIRLREDTALVRFSDLLRRAPQAVLEAAAAILLARLYRFAPPRNIEETYRRFTYSPRMRRRLAALRRARARRRFAPPRGTNHDLAPLFDALNGNYFHGRLDRPQLGWSARPWHTQLGCFDPALRQIVINSALDRREVPGYVVAYVLYHEMLHLKHPLKVERCRLESHSPQFRGEEKKFRDYGRAMRFLERFD